MIKPINLYMLSRISDVRAFKAMLLHNCVERSAFEDKVVLKCQKHEIQSLQILVNTLNEYGCNINEWDGFFYNFIIPQIGKEFDLLKIVNNRVLNIELKSNPVDLARIQKQLKQNRHYLAHLNRQIYSYTVVTSTLQCYRLTANGTLEQSTFQELQRIVASFCVEYAKDIEQFFCPSQFLISPLNTPTAFLKGRYFLTHHQELIKSDLLSKIDSVDGGYFCIKGEAGTGKTLLLYDIALQLAKLGNTLIVHCAKLPDNCQLLNCSIDNFALISIDQIADNTDILSKYQYILLDECHRLSVLQLQNIVRSVHLNKATCILSLDSIHLLTHRLQESAIGQLLDNLSFLGNYELTTKIRTNKQLATFIRYLQNLSKKPPRNVRFDNINVAYAQNTCEAMQIIEYFRAKGYLFINHNYYYCDNTDKDKSTLSQCQDYDALSVAGQEFDRVLVIMDKMFYHDQSGILCAKMQSQANYSPEWLFYQNITRVKEKLAIVVVDNEKLFKNIVAVFNYER